MTSKAEYLKRYMSIESTSNKRKKKEKKPVVDTSRVKILDDDVDFKSLLPENIHNTLDDDIGDDNPAVAEFVDERPQHVKELERFRQSKQWKVVSHPPDNNDVVNRSAGHAQSSVKDRHSAAEDRHRRRHDSDSDLDVPRHKPQQRHDSDSDVSPHRTKDRSSQRHDSDTSLDLSPVRSGSHSRQRATASSDLSPKRSVDQSSRHQDSDSDLSPVRAGSRVERAVLSASKAGKRARQQRGSDSDLSPPRARVQSSSKTARHDSDSDLSPPRTKNLSHTQGSDSDLSPVRCDRNSDRSVQQPVDRQARSLSPEKRTKTLSGAKAGLQLAADMRKEAKELKRREHASFTKISDEMLGKNAQTVVRDKATGRRRDLNAERAKQAETDAAKAATTAKYDAWNKGLRQKELQEEKISDALHEAEKPLARYTDDADLDARLREQEREGDTMLAYIRKKKEKGVGKSKPVYRGPEPPPNRFGIRPGYRWDGVDRSNGFEKLYFTKLSEKKAIKDMAYKWSVENM